MNTSTCPKSDFAWRQQSLEKAISDEERSGLETIRKRYEHWMLGGNSAEAGHPLVQRAEPQISDYIRRAWEYYAALSLPENAPWPELTIWRTESPYCSHHVFYNILLPLAMDYRRNGNQAALEPALRIMRWVEAAGFAAGNEDGKKFLSCLLVAPFPHATALLRDELAGLGMLERNVETVWWYSEFERAFADPAAGFVETNADAMRSSVFNSLVAILAMRSGARQVTMLRHWVRWLQTALEINPRLAGLLKPDGTGWHHRGIYTSAYAPEAWHFASLCIYLLHGTPFAVGRGTVDNVRLALRTHRQMAEQYDPPLATQGRIFDSPKPIPEAYVYLALAADPVDAAMAGIVGELCTDLLEDVLAGRERASVGRLRGVFDFDLDGQGGKFLCNQTLGRLELMARVLQMHVPARAPADGFLSKPWGGLALHRRAGWLASVKGWSQYVWDFEMHPSSWATVEENVFAQRISYGTLQIITGGSPAASGWTVHDGWDWSRWPGTTVIGKKREELYDSKTSWACRFFSAATFVGAVECGGRNGVFSMRLREHYYEPGFHALKSYFFFGNTVLCVGSNIESRDPEHPVETILFQCGMPESTTPVELNGATIRAASFEWSGEAGRPVSVMDPVGNAYLIPDGRDVRLRRGEQISRDAWNRKETRGNYTTCWLDHGKQPRDLGNDEGLYSYTILIQPGSGAIAAEQKHPSFQILRRDHRAHIARHIPTCTTAGAVFESDWMIPEGPLRRTDTPILYSACEEADGRLRLSIADPDLRLPHRLNIGFHDPESEQTPSRSAEVRVQVRGIWELPDGITNPRVEKAAHAPEGVTSLVFHCRDGATVEVLLRKSGL